MFRVYFATTNKGKIASLQRDLIGLEVEVVPLEIEIPEIRSEETAEIASRKVQDAYQRIQQPCVAQDGSFYITSLNGFPKAYVNFVLGTIGLDGLLLLVGGKDRQCEFQDALAYMDEKTQAPLVFTTVTRGMLAQTPRGELKSYHWGELHRVFIPEGQQKTLAEMTVEEMDSWRGKQQEKWCGRQFAQWLKEYRLGDH